METCATQKDEEGKESYGNSDRSKMEGGSTMIHARTACDDWGEWEDLGVEFNLLPLMMQTESSEIKYIQRKFFGQFMYSLA